MENCVNESISEKNVTKSRSYRKRQARAEYADWKANEDYQVATRAEPKAVEDEEDLSLSGSKTKNS